jgi:AcrR family transcriptional regulator
VEIERTPTRRRRLAADTRRAEIVESAFATVVDTGLEGLRTREVARRAGINIATLHHYFPTKEDLIVAVGRHLEAGYMQGRPRRAPARTPLAALHQEFHDVAFFRTQRPQWLAVSREFAARASRDSTAAAVHERLMSGWEYSVETVLRQGMKAGVFRENLDPRAASRFIVRALWAGTVFLPLSDRDFKALCRELERAIVGT